MIDLGKCRAQEVMDAPIAEAPPYQGDFDDGGVQLLGLPVGNGRMAVAIAGEPHKATGAALGQIEALDHLPDGLALDLWG